MRTRWLEELETRMERVPPKQIGASLRDPEPHERVVGKASEATMRLWGVIEAMNADIRTKIMAHFKEAGIEHDTETCKSYHEETDWEMAQNKVMLEMFWASLRVDTGLFSGNIGIRKGGVATTWDRDPNDPLDLMRALVEELKRARR